jgi:hypothetical protein
MVVWSCLDTSLARRLCPPRDIGGAGVLSGRNPDGRVGFRILGHAPRRSRHPVLTAVADDRESMA